MVKTELGICTFCGGEKEETILSHLFNAYGPKEILLNNIPGFKCKKCGGETISIDIANAGTMFLRKVGAGLVEVLEENGVLVAQFPAC